MKKTILITFLILLLSPFIIFAADPACKGGVDDKGKLTYCALEGKAFGGINTNTTSLGGFLSQAFSFGLAIAAALAVIMIVWGGVEIMLSESVTKKDDGKSRISGAIWGLLLALTSYLILYTINPDILNFEL
jgi:uncharacterized membrane protein